MKLSEEETDRDITDGNGTRSIRCWPSLRWW